MARLAGRKIIITGGASGIGRATARLFRREGAAVAILDRSDNAAKAVADEIGAVALACDVSDPQALDADNPDLVRQHGGKLLLYPGFADPFVTPLHTLDYYTAVIGATGRWPDPVKDTQSYARPIDAAVKAARRAFEKRANFDPPEFIAC